MGYGLFPEIIKIDPMLRKKIECCFEIENAPKIFIKKGCLIDSEDYANKFLLLSKGKCIVSLNSCLGIEKTLWYIDEGNVLYNEPLNDFFHTTIRAYTDCLVYCRAKGEIFERFCGYVDVIHYLFESSRLRNKILAERFHSLICESSRCRVFKFIYQYVELNGILINDNWIIVKNIPQQHQITSLVGVHRTNVAKYESFLEEQEIMVKTNHGIKFEIKRLKEIIEEEFCESLNY